MKNNGKFIQINNYHIDFKIKPHKLKFFSFPAKSCFFNDKLNQENQNKINFLKNQDPNTNSNLYVSLPNKSFRNSPLLLLDLKNKNKNDYFAKKITLKRNKNNSNEVIDNLSTKNFHSKKLEPPKIKNPNKHIIDINKPLNIFKKNSSTTIKKRPFSSFINLNKLHKVKNETNLLILASFEKLKKKEWLEKTLLSETPDFLLKRDEINTANLISIARNSSARNRFENYVSKINNLNFSPIYVKGREEFQ